MNRERQNRLNESVISVVNKDSMCESILSRKEITSSMNASIPSDVHVLDPNDPKEKNLIDHVINQQKIGDAKSVKLSGSGYHGSFLHYTRTPANVRMLVNGKANIGYIYDTQF